MKRPAAPDTQRGHGDRGRQEMHRLVMPAHARSNRVDHTKQKRGRAMARAPRICSIHDCPDTVTRLNRCRRHASELDKHMDRTTPTKRTRTWGERRRRADTVRAYREQHGDWCPGYKREPHAATDLTAQHVDAVADGGSGSGHLEVWCRSCNSRHGADTRNQYT